MRQLTAELISIVGSSYVMDQLEDRICYSFDGTFRDSLPDVVVRPKDKAEIAAVIQLAKQYQVPVTPRGAATGLSGGAVPMQGGITLVTTRLNKILKIDVENKVAVVEPGVVTQDFMNQVSSAGLYYPPDPASSKTSTIGGNISECAGGPHGVKYGITRDYVIGLEVVLPDGSIVQTGNLVDGEMAGLIGRCYLLGLKEHLG